MSFYCHPNALVETKDIGDNTRIWAFVHVLDNVKIGSNCNICDHCFIENDVVIGNNVTVKSGAYLWSGITIEDDVHIGPNVVFTNDLRPRSKQPFELGKITVRKGASLGANSTVLSGVEIGKFAMTGIGSVVTRNVKDHALIYGNPAKQKGWVDEQGEKLSKAGKGLWASANGSQFKETEKGLVKI